MSKIFKSENGVFLLEVSDDGFLAELTVLSKENNNENQHSTVLDSFINETELVNILQTSQITHGFGEALEIEKDFNKPFPIALGIKAKNPEIEFSPLFDTNKCFKKTIGNHFHLLKNYLRVSKGEPLAHLFVTKNSKPGIDIYGNTIEPLFHEDVIIENYLGENVVYSKERGQIIAERTGYPYMDEEQRIHVKSEFILDRDLDLTFEDMDFYGSLLINGDVIDKVKLKLTGDLTVKGNIKDADIEVDGNIHVEGDIVNCKSPGIYASGTITLTSAENSKIVAGNKVNFKKNLHFCKVVAEHGLYGNENTGHIVGGVYQSGEHIETAFIGNTSGIATEVEISISPYKKEKMEIINKLMNKLKDLELENSKDYLALHEELNNLEMCLEEEINLILKNQENLPKHIIAYKKVYSAIYVRILKKSMHITEELNKVNFSIVDGELTFENY